MMGLVRKQDYKDYWVYIEKGIDGKVLPVSLELCSEARKLADAAGEKLAAVYIGGIEAEDLEKVLDCGIEKLIHVEGTGFASFNIDAWTALSHKCEERVAGSFIVDAVSDFIVVNRICGNRPDKQENEGVAYTGNQADGKECPHVCCVHHVENKIADTGCEHAVSTQIAAAELVAELCRKEHDYRDRKILAYRWEH